MAGRRPLPTKVKQARGNPGKRGLNHDEPQPRAGRPTKPGWLAIEAKREWMRMLPELETMKVVTPADRAALASYCQWWARWRQAEEMLDKDESEGGGLVIEVPTKNGAMTVPSPWVKIAQAASDRCRRFLIEFGLTPAARSRLKIEKAPEVDPVLKRMSERRGGGGGGRAA